MMEIAPARTCDLDMLFSAKIPSTLALRTPSAGFATNSLKARTKSVLRLGSERCQFTLINNELSSHLA
jgi:hypothetical protein